MKTGKSILKEIKSRGRKDKLQRFLKEYKNAILTSIGLVIFAVLLLTIFKIQKRKTEEAYSYKFNSAINHLEEDNLAEAMYGLEEIYQDKKAPRSIRSLSGIRFAYLKLQTENTDKAITIYKEVFRDEKKPFLKYLAGTSAVNVLINQKDTSKNSEIEELLEELIVSKNPIQNLAKEQKALFKIQNGDTNDGVAIFEEILTDPNLHRGIKARIEHFLKIYK